MSGTKWMTRKVDAYGLAESIAHASWFDAGSLSWRTECGHELRMVTYQPSDARCHACVDLVATADGAVRDALAAMPPSTAAEIAQRLGAELASVTRALLRLEAAARVARRRGDPPRWTATQSLEVA